MSWKCLCHEGVSGEELQCREVVVLFSFVYFFRILYETTIECSKVYER